MFNKKAQSTIEYLILLTLITVICLIIIPKVARAYLKTINSVTDNMKILSTKYNHIKKPKTNNGNHYGQNK